MSMDNRLRATFYGGDSDVPREAMAFLDRIE